MYTGIHKNTLTSIQIKFFFSFRGQCLALKVNKFRNAVGISEVLKKKYKKKKNLIKQIKKYQNYRSLML